MHKILIIHHNEDNDGVLSAAILCSFIWRYSNRETLQIDTHGARYSELSDVWDDFKKHPGTSTFKQWIDMYDEVYMTDISFNEPEAMQYLSEHTKFTWIDHHAPAIETSIVLGYDNVKGKRDTTQSAIMNAWDYMVDTYAVSLGAPEEFISLSDYDSWAWHSKAKYEDPAEYEYLMCLNTGIAQTSHLSIYWFRDWVDEYIEGRMHDFTVRVNQCIDSGKIINTYDMERSAHAIKEYGDTSWTLGGEKACALFTTDHFNSIPFTDAFKKSDVRCGLVFKHLPDGRWLISGYLVDQDTDFHIGEYLKGAYGGGGHKGAAGCTVTQEDMFEILRTRSV